MHVHLKPQSIFAWVFVFVSIVSGCSDSVSLHRQEMDSTNQSIKENAAPFAHAHCHPRNLGPSHIADAEADRFRSAGTREMAERLKFIDLAIDPETNEFASDRRVEKLEYNQKLQPTLSGQFQLGLEYLRNWQLDRYFTNFSVSCISDLATLKILFIGIPRANLGCNSLA